MRVALLLVLLAAAGACESLERREVVITLRGGTTVAVDKQLYLTVHVEVNGRTPAVPGSPAAPGQILLAWTSSRPDVATVSSTGVVMGISPGSTTITVVTVSIPGAPAGQRDSLTVTVVP